jgi:predicted choloylglycine hydrolase
MVIFIKTKGNARERGFQQGQQLNDKIQSALNTLFNSKMFKQIKPKFVPISVVKLGLSLIGKKNIRPDLVKYMPEMVEKIKGLSEGSILSQNLCYGLHFFEVMNGDPKALYRNPPVNPPVPACTMLMATPPSTSDNNIYYARNYDFPKILLDFQMVREEIPDEGFRNISMTQFPLMGCHQAMNEKGLTIGYNYGRCWKTQPLDFRLNGLPGTFIVQKAIETCETTEEAVKFVSNFPARSNGVQYGIMDASGDAKVVETTATRFAIREPENGVLIHTNTYKTKELEDANLPLDVRFKMDGMDFSPIESPIRRFKRATILMNNLHGKINKETIKSVLTDHDNGDPNKEGPDDFSLCTHGKTAITLASIIVEPKKKKFWVIDRNPCTGEYEEFSL